ncbi:MAG: metallophosphoesterase family protein [Terriglobia bacterium]
MPAQKHIIGVISDTHGWLDKAVIGHFHGVEHILHAGDVGDLHVPDQLKGIAPVTAVSGNVDEEIDSRLLRAEETPCLFGTKIFMTHILGNPERLPPDLQGKISQINPALVVFGHTHQPYVKKIGGVLFLNPGSAGRKRFSLPRCIGILVVENGEVEATILEI